MNTPRDWFHEHMRGPDQAPEEADATHRDAFHPAGTDHEQNQEPHSMYTLRGEGTIALQAGPTESEGYGEATGDESVSDTGRNKEPAAVPGIIVFTFFVITGWALYESLQAIRCWLKG
ncbi:hypothetical protein N7G274_005297 [Stereocaulon virgatum]|uniref:Uncharacterized protein n=1 Tax=Stereocaulon virgatum TaxID=373712 RepID=A0ABR4ABM2_9LECA